ncbi:ABZJ_00895 family protein [Thioalkalivibrio sp. ALM2T]|uniref:ABZJ_00895 family protein n=1 Tax=Thioalkalivibrio sp. ALM2T TaxID=1158184 RepID=UPI00037F5668|nr:ABZJ_00895 family protein [Thioalkalivibrio sp. ALM2T]
MSIKGLLLRFALLYISLMIAASVAIAYFELEGIGTAIGMAILGVSVIWPCEAFGRKNGRYLSRGEKWRVITGMVALFWLTDVPLGLIAVLAGEVELDALFLGILAVVALVYALFIAAMVHSTGRSLRKRGLVADEAAQ